MPAGITSSDSMFSVRETPWHGLGAVLERPPATIAEAIEASGLGWRVEREPIAVDRGDAATANDWWEPRCEEIPGYYATVRQDTRAVLGIVGERYRIVQNEEAFQFVDQLLGSSLHFETAGSLHGGRRVWVLATLPEHVEVGGDAVRPVRAADEQPEDRFTLPPLTGRVGHLVQRPRIARCWLTVGLDRVWAGCGWTFCCGRCGRRRGAWPPDFCSLAAAGGRHRPRMRRAPAARRTPS